MKRIIAIVSGAILAVALVVAFLPTGVAAQEGPGSGGAVITECPRDYNQPRGQGGLGLRDGSCGNCNLNLEAKLGRVYQNRMAHLDRAIERLEQNQEQNAQAIARLNTQRMMLEERYQEAKQWLAYQGEWQTATGTVSAVNTEEHSLTIETSTGPITLDLSPYTRILKGGEAIFYDELESGDYISCVRYFTTDDGQYALFIME